MKKMVAKKWSDDEKTHSTRPYATVDDVVRFRDGGWNALELKFKIPKRSGKMQACFLTDAQIEELGATLGFASKLLYLELDEDMIEAVKVELGFDEHFPREDDTT